MHNYFQEIAQRVNDAMALASFDLFTGIVATFAAGFGGFGTLRINDSGSGFKVAPFGDPFRTAQDGVKVFRNAVATPFTIVIKHTLILGKVGGQICPLTACADDLKNGIDDFPQVQLHWASTPARTLQQWLQYFPFAVGQITCV